MIREERSSASSLKCAETIDPGATPEVHAERLTISHVQARGILFCMDPLSNIMFIVVELLGIFIHNGSIAFAILVVFPQNQNENDN